MRLLCWTSNLFLQKVHKAIQLIPGTLPDHEEITIQKYNNEEDTVSTIATRLFNMRSQNEWLKKEIAGSFQWPLASREKSNSSQNPLDIMKAVLRWKFINVPENHRDLNYINHRLILRSSGNKTHLSPNQPRGRNDMYLCQKKK